MTNGPGYLEVYCQNRKLAQLVNSFILARKSYRAFKEFHDNPGKVFNVCEVCGEPVYESMEIMDYHSGAEALIYRCTDDYDPELYGKAQNYCGHASFTCKQRSLNSKKV